MKELKDLSNDELCERGEKLKTWLTYEMTTQDIQELREYAVELAKRLRKSERDRLAMDGAAKMLAALAYDPDENGVERFERINDLFRADTGYMRPGKSYPAEAPCDLDGEELQKLFDGWVEETYRKALATYNAAILARKEKK